MKAVLFGNLFPSRFHYGFVEKPWDKAADAGNDGKLYDALRAANVPDEKARAAAVEAANFDNRLNKLLRAARRR